MDDEINFYRDRVLSGKEHVERVFENEHVLAFKHTNPSYPVHFVVIPKEEIDSILDLPLDCSLLVELVTAIKSVVNQIMETHGKCRVVTNVGKYQDSKHLHWHIISGKQYK